MTSGLGSISSIHTTPSRCACSSSTRRATSAPSSGVSGAPAHSTSCAEGSNERAASSRYSTPFWRVIRPTKTTDGWPGSTPWRSSTSVPGSGVYSSLSIPL